MTMTEHRAASQTANSPEWNASSEPVQLLDPNGTLQRHPEFSKYLDALGAEDLLRMYSDMVTTRRIDQEATALQRQGELHMWVPSLGQEAAQVGSGYATERADYIFPTYREHSIAFQRGVKPEELLQIFRGNEHAGWNPKDSNFHIYTLVLAAQTLHAVGMAMAFDRDAKRGIASTDATATQSTSGSATRGTQGNRRAVVAYFGDGSSSEGDVHESMVFAASFNAPVVFFCQNNGWAISVPFSVQSKVPLATRAAGYGFPGLRIDGNDVLASYAATAWALERAKNGEGPALIEAMTYRMGAHTTADDPTKYRTELEEQDWTPRDPLARFRTYLRNEGVLTEGEEQRIAAEADAEAERVREAILASTSPAFSEHFANIYAEENTLVSAEREDYLDYKNDGDTHQGGQA